MSYDRDQDDNEEEEEEELDRCALCDQLEVDSTNLTSQSTFQTNATPTCGHQFCEKCLKREFSRHSDFKCPKCSTTVKKSNLTYRSLDAVLCENDANWRRRILRIYNKTRSDFVDLKSYNDYLEEVEDMIYSIVNDEPNAEEYKSKLKLEEEKNKAEITQRQARKAEEDRMIQDQIEKERQEAVRRKREIEMEERDVAQLKRKIKKENQEVLLGQREEISAELLQAQMQGYATAVKLSRQGKAQAMQQPPRVREPEGGLLKHEPRVVDRTFQDRRRAAGGGIRSDNNDRETNQQRQWNETVATLFERVTL
jgi:CDK-activating kinase assembly factor MAT1